MSPSFTTPSSANTSSVRDGSGSEPATQLPSTSCSSKASANCPSPSAMSQAFTCDGLHCSGSPPGGMTDTVPRYASSDSLLRQVPFNAFIAATHVTLICQQLHHEPQGQQCATRQPEPLPAINFSRGPTGNSGRWLLATVPFDRYCGDSSSNTSPRMAWSWTSAWQCPFLASVCSAEPHMLLCSQSFVAGSSQLHTAPSRAQTKHLSARLNSWAQQPRKHGPP